MADIKLTTKQHSKIKRVIKSLNDIRAELQKENPEKFINWYLEDNDNLNLMEGNSHTDDADMNQDAIIRLFKLDHASGGAW